MHRGDFRLRAGELRDLGIPISFHGIRVAGEDRYCPSAAGARSAAEPLPQRNTSRASNLLAEIAPSPRACAAPCWRRGRRVGSALLQLGRLAGLEMYGTCSSRGASAVSDLGGIPIDYQHQDFVKEIHRLTSEGVDVVFDGIGGTHIWRSRKALRPGGRVVAYGLTSSLRGGRLASGRSGRRHRSRGIPIFGLYIAGGWLLPGRKRVVPYSIQWLKRRKPAWFRQDLTTLFDLLQRQKIKPLIAQRFPLAEARLAHELLGKGGVTGKIVLVRKASSLESGAA